MHRKLKGLLAHGEKEFFVCPYDLLENIIDTIINDDSAHNNLINAVIDTVHKLKCANYSPERWMSGIDTSIFSEEFRLVAANDDSKEPEIQATFDVTNATDAQKKEFVARCVQAYRSTIEEPNQLVWKSFQAFLLTQLHIPKYKFKSLYWRPLFNETATQNALP